LPPVWVMGLGFLPLAASGSLTLITTPTLLAANHVPEAQIASVTTIALIPAFIGFLLGPLLDWRFSRRFYAIAFAVVGAVTQFAGLLFIRDLAVLSVLLFVAGLAIGLCVSAVGGWFGNLTPTAEKSALGAWFTVTNLGAGGIIASLAIPALRELPYALGAALTCLTIVAAIPLFLVVECPPADGRLASESFAAFAGDVLALLRRPSVLWTLLIFLAPCASFALTNILSGLGRDYHTSEGLVGLIGGLGISVAGVIGSLSIPILARFASPRPLYLMVGGFGAIFTLMLTLVGRDPVTFGVAVLGENVFQAAAFSVGNMIVLRTIGHDNPLAATQFGLLNSAASLPLMYMQFIDGQGYGRAGGVNGAFLVDAGVSGAACVALALVLWLFRRRIPAI
ncbi:MAG TPA: MFS transporter, partial [Caulobacteraceae bacterium]|nr:MFS transporter [Caulobacteraceae bacterium]